MPQSNIRKTAKRKTAGYQDVLTESPYLRSIREKKIEKNRELERKNKTKLVKRKLVNNDLKENKNEKIRNA